MERDHTRCSWIRSEHCSWRRGERGRAQHHTLEFTRWCSWIVEEGCERTGWIVYALVLDGEIRERCELRQLDLHVGTRV